ncbi:MAG: peptidoglycan DD-metalloendopeptidase family protein [Solirubrobacterales bacterium]
MPDSRRDLARIDFWQTSMERSAQRRQRTAGGPEAISSSVRLSDQTLENLRAPEVAPAAFRDLADHHVWTSSAVRSRKRRITVPQQRRRASRQRKLSYAATAAIAAAPGGPFALDGLVAAATADAASTTPAARAIAPQKLDLLLDRGDRGPAVKQVQEVLSITADGVFGPETERAVRSFQRSSGLTADGVVGVETWSALFGPAAGGASATTAPAPSAPASDVPEDADITVRASSVRPDGEGGAHVTFVAQDVEAEDRGGSDDTSQAADPAPSADETEKTDSSPAEPKAEDDAEPNRSADTPEPKETEKKAAAPEATKPKAAPAPSPAPKSSPEPKTTKPVAFSCGSSKLVKPVRGVETSPYGPRWGRMHSGLDIAAPSGTRVVAAACGVVTTMESQGGYGNLICVKHSSTLTTCYAHLSKFATSKGATVHAGELIGYVGSTGNSTGPHLHFETRYKGSAKDPKAYLSGKATISGTPTVKHSGAVGGKDPLPEAYPAAKVAAEPTGSSQAGSVAPTGTEQQATAAPAPAPVPAAPAPVAQPQAVAPAPQPAPTPAPTAAPAPEVAALAAPAPVPAPQGAAPEQQIAEQPQAQAPQAPVAADTPASPVPAPEQAPAPEAPETAADQAPAPEAPAAGSPAPESPVPAPEAAPAPDAAPAAEAETPAADPAPAPEAATPAPAGQDEPAAETPAPAADAGGGAPAAAEPAPVPGS